MVAVVIALGERIFATNSVGITEASTAAVLNTGEKLYFDTASHGASVSIDYETRQMSGYAWSEDLGWVDFGAGADNPSGPVLSDAYGNLSGKAKALSGGYIDFGASPNGANVKIESGTGQLSGFAWSEDLGWIDFGNVVAPGFYLDKLPPDSPASVVAKAGTATLASGQFYNYPDVSFSWVAPKDNADVVTPSGVAGYYVYWGTDSTANPYTAGTYQSELNASFNLTPSGDGQRYFLRVVTADQVGNRSAPATLFEYRYDATKPLNPGYVSVSPIGWSTTNSFNFTWPAATDTGTGASGIAGYQYKRAGGGDDWSSTIPGASVAGMQAYQNGQNEFYVRSVDVAGNVAENFSTVRYYYNGEAPGVPPSLTVTPPNAQANSFTFSWSEPTSNNGVKGYYYSVNAVPTINNSVFTSARTTGAIPAATQQGFNTLYVVAVDNSDRINWGNYATATFECNTTAPGIPGGMVISDSSNRADSNWALTTNWKASSGAVAKYNIYRSTDGSHFAKIAETRSVGYLDTGLANTSTYYYKVTGVDSAGAESVASSVVTRQPTGKFTEPPLIVAGPEFKATATTAVVTWSTNRPSSSFVSYSTDESYSENKGQLEAVTSHKVLLSGLTPGTSYHFKVQSLDDDRDYLPADAYSIPYGFTTDKAPGIEEVTVTDITLSSATITWKTTTVAQSTIAYGLTNTYGQQVKDSSASAVTQHSIKLTGLSHTSTYHFKITGTDTDGNQLVSDDYNFNTLTYPRLSSVMFEGKLDAASSTTTVTWQSNVLTTSTVLLYEGASLIPREISLATLTLKHAIQISGLKDDTDYHVVAQGRDSYGNLASSDRHSFRTALDTRPPQISGVNVETAVKGNGSEARGQFVVSWTTDEPATSQVAYGQGSTGDYGSRSTEDTRLTTEHVVIISNLPVSTVYHLQPISKDKASNSTAGARQSAIIGQPSESVFNIIINSLLKVFGM